ncbi:metalloendopeptidase [Quaeritorhiza haematococci]|nr:metalloendopeptidase [Quaeritorhiza haematococci]
MWTLASVPVVGTGVLVAQSYERHPLTQRGRLMLIDENTEMEVAESEYNQLIKQYYKHFLQEGNENFEICRKICQNLVDVVGPVRDWTLHVIDDPDTIQAFVLSSGKVFVFTGMINQVESEDQLAAILAHEVGHVLSRHSGETQGVALIYDLGQILLHSLLYAFTVNLPLLGDAGGLALEKSYPLLTAMPHSRLAEYEADVIGLYLMAIAGYNPQAAIDLWEKFYKKDLEAGQDYVEFTSTHPSHENRAAELRNHISAASEVYKARQTIAAALRKHNIEKWTQNMLDIDQVDRNLYQVLAAHVQEETFWFAKDATKNDLVQRSKEIEKQVALSTGATV